MGVLFLLVSVFAGTWLTGNTFFARDLTLLFHPMHSFTAQSLQAGVLPVWNPYVSGGVSWLGQPQTGVFSPGNLFFWVFPFVWGFKLFQVAHFFLAALGGYLVVRGRRGGGWVALGAAVLWSLNGFWRSRLEFPPLLGVLTWTPWFLLFTGAQRFRGPAALGLSIATALALLAGHWPHLAWIALVVGAAALSTARPLRRTMAVAVSAAVGGAMAAVQGMPGWDLLKQSDRLVSGMGASVADRFALSVRQWLGLVAPVFSDFPAERYTGERFFWLGCFFVGGTALLLAGRAARWAPVRARWAWAGVFVLGATQSLGPLSPLYRFLFAHAPVFSGVRYPAQYAFWMVTAVVAVFSLYGSDHWSRGVRWSVLGLLCAELLWWGNDLAPMIRDDYFQSKPSWVTPLQNNPGRLFLSPRAVTSFSVEGDSFESTWTGYRHRLLSLGTLPYRIENINPFGFSLNPARNERVLSSLYASTSPVVAREKMDALGVRWVAAPAPLDFPGATLLGTDSWFLYERRDFQSGIPIEGTSPPVFWTKHAPRLDTRVFEGPTAAGILSTGEWGGTGWTAHTESRSLRLADQGDFAAVTIDGSVKKVWLRYRSVPGQRGLLGTLGAVGLLCGIGVHRLKRKVVA